MFKWVGAIGVFVLLVLAVSVLCTELNTRQTKQRAANIELDTAIKRNQAAKWDLENAFYRRVVLKKLAEGVSRKDNWEDDLEELKRLNGFYEGEEK